MRCRICHQPSEAVDCCQHCLYAPLWRLLARHPVRCMVTGYLHMFGVI
jgi:hypothetical protein